jgi:hypothetical protein
MHALIVLISPEAQVPLRHYVMRNLKHMPHDKESVAVVSLHELDIQAQDRKADTASVDRLCPE